MILWIFGSLVGTWAQIGALVIRHINPGIKMETEFILKNNEGHTIILLFAESVHGKMRHHAANKAGRTSWRGKRSSPSSSPSLFTAWTGKLSLLNNYLIYLLVHPKLPNKEEGTPKLKGRKCSLSCVWGGGVGWGVYQRFQSRLGCAGKNKNATISAVK